MPRGEGVFSAASSYTTKGTLPMVRLVRRIMLICLCLGVLSTVTVLDQQVHEPRAFRPHGAPHAASRHPFHQHAFDTSARVLRDEGVLEAPDERPAPVVAVLLLPIVHGSMFLLLGGLALWTDISDDHGVLLTSTGGGSVCGSTCTPQSVGEHSRAIPTRSFVWWTSSIGGPHPAMPFVELAPPGGFGSHGTPSHLTTPTTRFLPHALQGMPSRRKPPMPRRAPPSHSPLFGAPCMVLAVRRDAVSRRVSRPGWRPRSCGSA